MSQSTTEYLGTPEEAFHWIPGEMVVIVRLPQLPVADVQETLVEQVRTQLNAFFAPYHFTLEPYGTAGRWSDFPTMPPVRRRSFVFGLNRKQPLIAIFFHTRHSDPNVRDPTPMALSYLQSHLEQLSQVGLNIVSAMPNWLVTAAPVYYNESGPALPPRPAPTLDVAAPSNTLVGWHLKLLEQQFPLDAQEADDVLIAVLDTAPHPDRLRSAATRLEFQRNWLLQKLASGLRNEDGSFAVEYDRYPLTEDVRTGRDYQNDPRYYHMPDHGLSLVGLIRDLAPRAHIRLVRVLNDFGGGDLYSLFAALTDLEREIVSGVARRLIINLSLTIMPDIRRLPYVWFDQRGWSSSQLPGIMRVLTHLEEGLRLIFEGLAEHGALLVAAAGNDSAVALEQGYAPRPPRAPARYENVLSVSSVNSQFQPSRFANAANIPPSLSGVATFGGDSYGATDGNALPDAVRGIFISPTFPTGEQNTSGWADLCGTSYAAAIVSGLAAHLMAQGWSASNIITRLASGQERQAEALFGAPPVVPSLLANVIHVQQRFGL